MLEGTGRRPNARFNTSRNITFKVGKIQLLDR